MEIMLPVVVLLFLIPFPKKWGFIRQLRYLGLGVLALTSGVTLLPLYGTAGLVGGIALLLAAVFFIYLTVRPLQPTRRSGSGKK